MYKNYEFYKTSLPGLFIAPCKEMDSGHEDLVHCEVRWLFRGNVLKRILEMRELLNE